MSYVELHCHSYYSFHDGASSLEELLPKAKELGYRALALTDHGTISGWIKFYQCCTKPEERWGINPIFQFFLSEGV
jgi:DNA polymerase III alpha subunit